MSISNDTFIAQMLESVGGINVFGTHPDRFPEVDLAELKQAPDVVLLSSEPFPFKDQHRDEFCTATNIDVGRVRFIDGEYASWHGHRMIDGLRYLSQKAQDQWDASPPR